jgi:hypothetical protein
MCEDRKKGKFKTCLPQAGAKLKIQKKPGGLGKPFFTFDYLLYLISITVPF